MPKVGSRGQLVIIKEIRDALGIKPGWLVTEEVANGKLYLSFRPPDEPEVPNTSAEAPRRRAKHRTTSPGEDEG